MPSNMEPNMVPENDSPGGHLTAGVSAPPAPGYETRDANTSGVLLFLGLLAAMLALVLLFSWGLFREFSVSINNKPPDSPFTGVREVPSAPRLQVTPREDLQRILADQQSKLETYGWEDRQAGTVRIPIERAMDLLVQKGLPVATPGPSGPSRDNSPGYAGSRNLRRENAGVDAGDQERVPVIASAPAGSKRN
jgi:hypothetical protein